MKTCPNCRTIHQNEYNGTCHDCGAPLGNVAPDNGGGGGTDLSFKFARQVQEGQREGSHESSMRRGNYDGVRIQDSVLDVARGFIVVDHEKLKEAQSG